MKTKILVLVFTLLVVSCENSVKHIDIASAGNKCDKNGGPDSYIANTIHNPAPIIGVKCKDGATFNIRKAE